MYSAPPDLLTCLRGGAASKGEGRGEGEEQEREGKRRRNEMEGRGTKRREQPLMQTPGSAPGSGKSVARNLFWGYKSFGGCITLQYSCSVAVLASFLPHRKFTWTDLGVYIPHIPPSLRPCQGSGCGDESNPVEA